MPCLLSWRESAAATVNPREENHVASFNQRITSGSYGVTDSRIVRRPRKELTGDSRDKRNRHGKLQKSMIGGERTSAGGLPLRRLSADKNQQTSFPWWWLPPPSTHAKLDDRDSLSPVYIRQVSVERGGEQVGKQDVNKGRLTFDQKWTGRRGNIRSIVTFDSSSFSKSWLIASIEDSFSIVPTI